MARYPRGKWRPLPENDTAPKRSTAHATLIFHSAVGSGSPWGYFARASTVTESHGWTGLAGNSEQFLDTLLRADAQWDANPWAISWETADNGHPDEFEWTPAQIEELANVAAWAHVTHGVPLRPCKSWDDSGIGYHRQFPQWNHSSHSCPGDVRVKQVPAIIARAIEIVEEQDMPTADEIAKAVWGYDLKRFPDGPDSKNASIWLTSDQAASVDARDAAKAAETAAEAVQADVARIDAVVDAVNVKTAAIAARVVQIPTTTAVVLSDAQIAAIAAQVPKPPTAAQVAAEVIAQLRAHPLTPKP